MSGESRTNHPCRLCPRGPGALASFVYTLPSLPFPGDVTLSGPCRRVLRLIPCPVRTLATRRSERPLVDHNRDLPDLGPGRKLDEPDGVRTVNKFRPVTVLLFWCRLYLILSRTRQYCFIVLDPSKLLSLNKRGSGSPVFGFHFHSVPTTQKESKEVVSLLQRFPYPPFSSYGGR